MRLIKIILIRRIDIGYGFIILKYKKCDLIHYCNSLSTNYHTSTIYYKKFKKCYVECFYEMTYIDHVDTDRFPPNYKTIGRDLMFKGIRYIVRKNELWKC